MTTPTVETAAKLGTDLIAFWVASGGPPRVPSARREEVVATLTRCMVSEPLLEAYARALEAGWFAHRSRPPLLGFPAGDVPGEQIVRGGFAALSDAALADIAVDPAAVRAVFEMLNFPSDLESFTDQCEWLLREFDAAEREKQRVTVPPVPSAPVPSSLATARSPRWTRVVPWAVAATALVAVFAMWASNRGTGPGLRDQEVLVARAAPTRVEPRGASAAVAFDLDVRAERPGFVTVIVFPVGKEPRVYPDYGQDEARVSPEAPASVGPFEAPVDSPVLIVVTETPATDIVRRVVNNLPPAQWAPETVSAAVQKRLFASGHNWAAFAAATAKLPKS